MNSGMGFDGILQAPVLALGQIAARLRAARNCCLDTLATLGSLDYCHSHIAAYRFFHRCDIHMRRCGVSLLDRLYRSGAESRCPLRRLPFVQHRLV
jgi:hypothetical protein